MTAPFGALIRAGIGIARAASGGNDAGESLAKIVEGLSKTGPVDVGAVVKFEGVEQVLGNVLGSAADLRPVFAARIDPDVSRLMREQFETEGKALGTPWPRLSVTTVRLRTRVVGKRVKRSTNRVGRAKFGFAAVLRDTGRLSQSLIVSGAPEGVREIDRLRYARGTSVPYAAFHQEGGTVRLFGRGPKRNVPARIIIPAGMPAPVINAWEGYIVKYLETGSA